MALLCLPSLLAQPFGSDPEALKRLSLEELSQLEVTTPSKEPVKAFRSSSAVFVITGDDIRRMGATSIPAALRYAPGVEVAQIDGSKWSVGIRGFGSQLTRSVLVLIDGRTVFTPLFNGTYWEVQDTLMEDIDRIEVIRGPGATIWGPNAVNGVINVITKNSRDTAGSLVSAGGGNVEQGFMNLRYGGGNGKGLSYRIYGKAFTRGSHRHSNGRSFDDWRSGRMGFRADWTANSRDTVLFEGDIYGAEQGQSVQATSYTAPYSRVIDSNADLAGAHLMARWNRSLGEGSDLMLQVYVDRTNRFEANFGEVRDTLDIDFMHRFRIRGRQHIAWGLGARTGPVENIEVVSGLSFSPSKRTDYLTTAFLEDEIELLPSRLSLTLGAKLLKTNFTGRPFLQPSARLLWTPDDRQSVWAAFTHAIRTPSDAEANFNLSGYIGPAGNGTQFFARFNANPRFAPEQLNGYELGYRTLFGKKVLIDLTGFYNRYHSLFSQEITGPAFLETNPSPPHLLLPAQFGNGLLGATKGVEIAPEFRPAAFWRLRGSYSHLHMNLSKGPGSIDIGTSPRIMGSSPQHHWAIQSALDLPKRFQFDLAVRYVSVLPGQNVQAYTTGDARLGWRFLPSVELSLVGQNLLQPYHAEFGGNPTGPVAIRRGAYLKLTWTR